MSRVSSLFIFAAIVTAVIAWQPTCAYACSCVAPGTPAAERDQSDAVFQGTVVDVKAASGAIASAADAVTVTFQTSTVWKGNVTQTFVLSTPGSSASCGISFETGKDYVVYARLNEGVLSATLCSRTNLVENAADDIATLGQSQAPAAGPQSPASLPQTGAAASRQPIGAIELMLLAAGLLTLGVWIQVSTSRRINSR